jgi:hypothetical protein
MVQTSSFWLHPSHPLFDPSSIGGIFTLTHLLFTIVLAMIGYAFFRFVRNLDNAKQFRFYQRLAIVLLLLEITRMLWNILAADRWYAKDVLPLYTCGIFVIIFPFYAFQSRFQGWVKGFITLGAMMAGILFLIFPSTGLGMFPLWHVNTLISSLMHVSMAVIGAVFYFNQKTTIAWVDVFTASVVVGVFALLSWGYNTLDPETNFFFIARPLVGTPLEWLHTWVGGQPMYGIAVVVVHMLVGLLMFYGRRFMDRRSVIIPHQQ